jgi:hypothetical protein
MMSTLSFLAVELLFLGATHVLGGPPWTMIGMIAFIAQVFIGVRLESVARLLPSLLWLVLFRVSGDRELFFPYTMYLASHVALGFSQRNIWLASLGGGGIVAAFMTIRVLQNATFRVLAVELVVAVAILAVALVAHAWSRKQAASDALIVAGASLLAYVSLSI